MTDRDLVVGHHAFGPADSGEDAKRRIHDIQARADAERRRSARREVARELWAAWEACTEMDAELYHALAAGPQAALGQWLRARLDAAAEGWDEGGTR